jgi:hypothetical protein
VRPTPTLERSIITITHNRSRPPVMSLPPVPSWYFNLASAIANIPIQFHSRPPQLQNDLPLFISNFLPLLSRHHRLSITPTATTAPVHIRCRILHQHDFLKVLELGLRGDEGLDKENGVLWVLFDLFHIDVQDEVFDGAGWELGEAVERSLVSPHAD